MRLVMTFLRNWRIYLIDFALTGAVAATSIGVLVGHVRTFGGFPAWGAWGLLFGALIGAVRALLAEHPTPLARNNAREVIGLSATDAECAAALRASVRGSSSRRSEGPARGRSPGSRPPQTRTTPGLRHDSSHPGRPVVYIGGIADGRGLEQLAFFLCGLGHADSAGSDMARSPTCQPSDRDTDTRYGGTGRQMVVMGRRSGPDGPDAASRAATCPGPVSDKGQLEMPRCGGGLGTPTELERVDLWDGPARRGGGDLKEGT
jgi:hypothetical protein